MKGKKFASLIVDYGENQAFTNSMTGIANHKLLPEDEWLNAPGDVDLSAYVNFLALANIAKQYKDLRVIGGFP